MPQVAYVPQSVAAGIGRRRNIRQVVSRIVPVALSGMPFRGPAVFVAVLFADA
jgi:hypothetical protein